MKIWKDKWLPQPSTYMVQTPYSLLHLEATDSELIDGDSGWWNSTLLENIFTTEEVHLIQSLPVSVSNREDRRIWSGTKKGFFSVRSAYHL